MPQQEVSNGKFLETVITSENKAGYTATLVTCGWARAVLEKVTRASGQEPYMLKKLKIAEKVKSGPTD